MVKDQKFIIGFAASALGIAVIIFLLRKIQKEAAAAKTITAAAPEKTVQERVSEMLPGLTTEERALYSIWERFKSGNI